MEGTQANQEPQIMNQNENINEVQNKISQQKVTPQVDSLPNPTLYINNLNEKMKNDGNYLGY